MALVISAMSNAYEKRAASCAFQLSAYPRDSSHACNHAFMHDGRGCTYLAVRDERECEARSTFDESKSSMAASFAASLTFSWGREEGWFQMLTGSQFPSLTGAPTKTKAQMDTMKMPVWTQ